MISITCECGRSAPIGLVGRPCIGCGKTLPAPKPEPQRTDDTHARPAICFVCRVHPERVKDVVDEGGVTSNSIHNAHVLIKRHGLPDAIELRRDVDDGQIVRAWWDKDRREFEFSGFAWGYGGTGPHGLLTFLHELVGIDVTLAEIAGWDPDPPQPRYERGRDYTTVSAVKRIGGEA